MAIFVCGQVHSLNHNEIYGRSGGALRQLASYFYCVPRDKSTNCQYRFRGHHVVFVRIKNNNAIHRSVGGGNMMAFIRQWPTQNRETEGRVVSSCEHVQREGGCEIIVYEKSLQPTLIKLFFTPSRSSSFSLFVVRRFSYHFCVLRTSELWLLLFSTGILAIGFLLYINYYHYYLMYPMLDATETMDDQPSPTGAQSVCILSIGKFHWRIPSFSYPAIMSDTPPSKGKVTKKKKKHPHVIPAGYTFDSLPG